MHESLNTNANQQPPILDETQLQALTAIRREIARVRSGDESGLQYEEQVSGVTADGLFLSVEAARKIGAKRYSKYVVRSRNVEELSTHPLKEETLEKAFRLGGYASAQTYGLVASFGFIFLEAGKLPVLMPPPGSMSPDEAEAATRTIFPFGEDGQPYNPQTA
jgi:hypothetical protein